MRSPLTTAETIIGFLPLVLLAAIFVVVPAKPVYGVAESGKRYRKVDLPSHVPLLGTHTFWLFFSVCMGSAAAWALIEASLSATQSGTISLPGTRGHLRPVVPWQVGWAYLGGLGCMLLSSIVPYIASRGSNAQFWLKFGAALLGIAGYLLVLLSLLLSSWQGVGMLLVTVAAAAAFLQRHRRAIRTRAPKDGG